MTESIICRSELKSLGGWVLHKAIDIETNSHVGVLRHLFVSSTFLRQSIISVLSLYRPETACDLAEKFGCKDPATAHSAIADAITSLRPRELIGRAFGSVPDGYLGLLARLKGEVLEADRYQTLFDLFAAGDRKARTLQQIAGPIGPSMVDFVLEVDPVAIHPSTLSLLHRSSAAREFNSILRLIRLVCSEASDERIAMSLSGLHKSQCLRDWANRWLTRSLDRLPFAGPFEHDEDFVVLSSGPALTEAARNFRNCLGRQVRAVAAGQAAYALCARHMVIVEFRRLAPDGWIALQAWGPENAPPDADAAKAVVRFLKRHDIPALRAPGPVGDQILRYLGVYEGREGIACEDDDLSIRSAA